jgi:hypothetical protein
MREKYQQEKAKQGDIYVALSMWTPWYEIFDNIFGSIYRIRGVPNEVDQRVHLQHEEVNVLSDDEDTIPIIPLNKTPSSTLDTTKTKATKQPHCFGQVNKSLERKRRLTIGDLAIASAINEFFDGVKS